MWETRHKSQSGRAPLVSGFASRTPSPGQAGKPAHSLVSPAAAGGAFFRWAAPASARKHIPSQGLAEVRLAGEAVPSAVLLEEKPNVTSAAGWRFKKTEKVALLPPSTSLGGPPQGPVRRTPELSIQEGNAALARRDYSAAEQQFRELLRLIDDPDMGGRLGDLRTLVMGFVDLTAANAAPPAPEPKPEPRREEVPPPAPQVAAPDPQRVYSSDFDGVTPAQPISQEVPRVPMQIANQTRERGILDVTIDEQGRVIAAAIRVGLHPIYDSQILLAAKEWRYQPATMNGRPVKFRKIIQITVSKR